MSERGLVREVGVRESGVRENGVREDGMSEVREEGEKERVE